MRLNAPRPRRKSHFFREYVREILPIRVKLLPKTLWEILDSISELFNSILKWNGETWQNP